jgi:hypothetical protein
MAKCPDRDPEQGARAAAARECAAAPSLTIDPFRLRHHHAKFTLIDTTGTTRTFDLDRDDRIISAIRRAPVSQ